jgi:hypothetical protein
MVLKTDKLDELKAGDILTGKTTNVQLFSC